MRYPIEEGWMIDKNEVPELFGPATAMWVLAAAEQPDVALLCYPRHMDGPVPVEVVTRLGLEPGDCFWRIAKVEVVAAHEMAVGKQRGAETFRALGKDWPLEDVCDAWHLKDGSYVLVREDEVEERNSG